MKSYDAYYTGLLVAWAARIVVITGVFAVLAIMSGCTHNLDLSSKGNLSKGDPPSTNAIAN
jgi:hypothetical protein